MSKLIEICVNTKPTRVLTEAWILSEAPASIRSRTTSTHPFIAANINAVQPFLYEYMMRELTWLIWSIYTILFLFILFYFYYFIHLFFLLFYSFLFLFSIFINLESISKWNLDMREKCQKNEQNIDEKIHRKKRNRNINTLL